MIFRQFDLSTEEELVEEILNNPLLMPIELEVSCLAETGYTTLLLRAQQAPEPRSLRWARRIRRFVLYGGANEELNQLLEHENTRVIKRYDYFTTQGVIIVLDYETKPEE